MRPRHLSTLLAFGFLASLAVAQNTSTVTGNAIEDAAGSMLASGTICLLPTDSGRNAANFMAGGGGQVLPVPVCRDVINGSIQTTYLGNYVGPLTVKSSAYTSPANIQYKIVVSNNLDNSSYTLGYASITGSPWSLDNFTPNNVQTLPIVGPSYVTGPLTATGPVTAPDFVGALQGNADTATAATALATAPTGCPVGQYSPTLDAGANANNCLPIQPYVALPLAGGVMLGPIQLPGDPVTAMQAADKNYVDNSINSAAAAAVQAVAQTLLPLSGGVMLGPIQLAGDPTTSTQAATKHYVDSVNAATAAAAAQAAAASSLPITGGSMLGALQLQADPTVASQAATKRYVDSATVGVAQAAGQAAAAAAAPAAAAAAALVSVPLDGSKPMSGPLVLPGDPTAASQAATKRYVDTATVNVAQTAAQAAAAAAGPAAAQAAAAVSVPLAGGAMTGGLILSGDPTTSTQAATKHYVDTSTAATAQAAATAAASAVAGTSLPLTGGSLSGALQLPGDPTAAAQAANKHYVDTAVAGTVAAATTAAAAQSLPITGGTMRGAVVLAGDPTSSAQAATKNYVDAASTSAVASAATAARSTYLPIAGGAALGPIVLPADPTTSTQAATKHYVDTATAAVAQSAATAAAATSLPLAGGTMHGAVLLAGDPTSASMAATKNYVDTAIAGVVVTGGGSGTGVPTYLTVSPAPNNTLKAFSISNGQSLTLNFAPTTSDTLKAIVAGGVLNVTLNGQALVPTTDYTLSGTSSSASTPATYMALSPTPNSSNTVFTIASGQTITLTFAPTINDTLKAQVSGSGVAGVIAVLMNGFALTPAADYSVSIASGSSGGGSSGGTSANCGITATQGTCGSLVTTPSTVATSTGQAATGTGLSACQAITSGGSYYLTQDVTCTTQGFAINADNVNLDLNNHVVTYGNPSTLAPAISLCDTFYTALPSNACGNGHHANFNLANGTITEAANAMPFTHPIWIGQGTGIVPGSIRNVTINASVTGTMPIHGDYPGNGWTIDHNIINDSVTNIQQSGQAPLSARSQLQGLAIYLNNGGGSDGKGDTSGPGDTITNNTINGSPQGGIATTNKNALIDHNTITLSTYYSNDYGVMSLVDGATITNNTIVGLGRGIDTEGSNFTVSGNYVNVTEPSRNSEYGGCEFEGAYAYRIKQYVNVVSAQQDTYTPQRPVYTGWTINGNYFKATASACPAYGLAFSNMLAGVTGTIYNNVFATSGAQQNTPLKMSGGANPAITWTVGGVGNTFSGGSGGLFIEDGGGDIYPSAQLNVTAGQTWVAGGTSEPTFLFQDIASAAPQIANNVNTGGDPQGLPEYIALNDDIRGLNGVPSTPTRGCYSYSTGKAILKNSSGTTLGTYSCP